MDMVQEGLNARSPKNKKQIGRVGKKDKIYIEDYAVTYLHQIARSTEHKSGFAGLFGTCREVEGTKEYYIYAAVYQESENVPSGGLPRELVQKIMRRRGELFSEYFFLGWAFILGETAGTMWESCYRSRLETLMGKPELLMTLKRMTCEEHFYLYPTEMPKETEGYFIFYEQNDAMQNFLIDWHGEIQKDKCDEEGDNVAESCRNYYKEKRAARLRTRLTGIFFVAAAVLLIISAGIGIQNLNQYDKIQEVGQAVSEVLEAEANAESVSTEYVADNDYLNVEVAEQEPSYGSEYAVAEYNRIKGEYLEEDSESVEEQISELVEETSTSGNEQYVPEALSVEEETESVVETDIQDITEIKEESNYEEEPEEIETVTDMVEQNVEAVADNYVTYEVSKGDTLYGICVRFYGNLSKAKEICELNGIENKDNILYGQKILLPE